MIELYDRDHPKIISDDEIMKQVEENAAAKQMQPRYKAASGIIVKGIDDVAVRFSKCCSPVPGDEIVGFVTRGRGISIHRTDCVNIMYMPEIDRTRLIDAEWQEDSIAGNGRFFAEIIIYANNRNGLLADVSRALTEKNIDIISLNTRLSKKGLASMSVAFEISSKNELNRIIDKLSNVESVVSIERTTG
jgi:GTP pyrophosphokinase